jgi:hypothetical protein
MFTAVGFRVILVVALSGALALAAGLMPSAAEYVRLAAWGVSLLLFSALVNVRVESDQTSEVPAVSVGQEVRQTA